MPSLLKSFSRFSLIKRIDVSFIYALPAYSVYFFRAFFTRPPRRPFLSSEFETGRAKGTPFCLKKFLPSRFSPRPNAYFHSKNKNFHTKSLGRMTTAKKSMIFLRAFIKLFENLKQKKRCRSALFCGKRRPAVVKRTERKVCSAFRFDNARYNPRTP